MCKETEEGLARFSSKLVSDEESALVDGLENLLNACRVSRVSFFINQNDPDKGLCMRQYVEVCAADVSPKAQNNTQICLPYNKRWKNELENGFPVTGTIDEFPDSETETLKRCNILSILILPVFVEGLWEGFIAFEDTVVRRNWKKDDAILLQTAASMIGAYLFRKRSKTALMESETYLKTIMATIQTGVLITDPESGKIIDANSFAAEMIGYPEEKLIGNDFHRFVCYEENETGRNEEQPVFGNNDCMLRSHSGEKFHVRQSSRRTKLKNRDYMVQSFLDISDIKQLLRKQEINIDISKKTLFLINGFPERHMPCLQNANLFTDVIYLPCYSEGGDHFFARNLYKNGQENTRKSVISLKDQSGHEVGCILRSIYTDLIHNAILELSPLLPVQTTVSILNDAVVSSGIFQADDFFTSIIAQIDQKDLNMTFVSAGHPPFILIRDQAIYFLPDIVSSGKNFPAGVFPGCKFQEETIPLQIGDRLIFYTDGLTEMTVRNTQRPLKLSMLEELLQNILVDNLHAGISVIIRLLLEKIVEISGENVHPDGRNSSTDDVTIIGVEVENDANDNEIIITPQNISDLYQKIETLYQEMEAGWKRREFRAATPRLKSVLEEGIMNAWRHGNRENPEKTITVRWRFGNDFHLEIIDEGEGFSLNDVPDPTADENLLKPTGRGIYLMKRYGDGVGWYDQGRRMTAFFKKEGKTKMDTEKNHYRFPLWNWGAI